MPAFIGRELMGKDISIKTARNATLTSDSAYESRPVDCSCILSCRVKEVCLGFVELLWELTPSKSESKASRDDELD